MRKTLKKLESRIIPEETNNKFFAQELKAYEFASPSVSGRRILELGSGDGYGAAYLAQTAKEVIAVGYEEEVVLRAREKYIRPNLKFLCMDVTEIAFKDNSFDILCSFQVIEHIFEDRLSAYFSEIKRVLKNCGEFYISTLNLENNMKSPLTYQKNPAHCKEFVLKEFKSLLESVFPSVEIFGLYLTPKHRFYLSLKKTGIFKLLPPGLNPVRKFYDKVTTNDFFVLPVNRRKAIDLYAICKNLKAPGQ